MHTWTWFHRNEFRIVIFNMIVPRTIGTWETIPLQEVERLLKDSWCKVRGDPRSSWTFGPGEFPSLLCALTGKYLGGWKRIAFFEVDASAAQGEVVFLHFRSPENPYYVRRCAAPLFTRSGVFGVLLGRHDIEFIAATAAGVVISLTLTETISRTDAFRYPVAPLF